MADQSKEKQPKSVIRSHLLGLNDNAEGEMPISSVRCSAPISTSQIRIVISLELDASLRPSGERATDVTKDAWPSSVHCSALVSTSQIRTAISSGPDASLHLS